MIIRSELQKNTGKSNAQSYMKNSSYKISHFDPEEEEGSRSVRNAGICLKVFIAS